MSRPYVCMRACMCVYVRTSNVMSIRWKDCSLALFRERNHSHPSTSNFVLDHSLFLSLLSRVTPPLYPVSRAQGEIRKAVCTGLSFLLILLPRLLQFGTVMWQLFQNAFPKIEPFLKLFGISLTLQTWLHLDVLNKEASSQTAWDNLDALAAVALVPERGRHVHENGDVAA